MKTRRKVKSFIMLSLSALMALYGLFWLFWILGALLVNGFRYLTPDLVLLDPTPPGMEGGGLRPAFVGHLILVGLATLIGVPVGLLAGLYLAEYASESRLSTLLRNVTDIMVSTPSIIMGAVVYAILVKPIGHFNGFAGGVSLAFLMAPVVAVTTMQILQLVPQPLREAAYALGAYRWQVVRYVVMRSARAGIITGIILGVARISGETAPLLFTSFNNNYLSLNLGKPMASVTVTVFNYVMGPYHYWHQQAWAAAFILTLSVLILSFLARWIISRRTTQKEV